VKKEQRMAEIKAIYEESHEIYGAPKIAAKMRQKVFYQEMKFMLQVTI